MGIAQSGMRRLSPAVVITLGLSQACASSRVANSEISRYPRMLNPQDAEGRVILQRNDGSCYVNLPFPEPPSSAGMSPPSRTVECPPVMRQSAFGTCADTVVLANEAGDDCVCEPAGNPPPPTVPRVRCPR